MSRRWTAASLVGLAAVLWGLQPAPIIRAFYDPLGTAWTRALVSAVFLGALLYMKGGLSRRCLTMQCMAGFFFAACNILFVLGIMSTTVESAMLLFFLYTSICLLLEWPFHRRRPKFLAFALIAIQFAGISVVYGPRLTLNYQGLNSGDLLSFLSGVAFAAHLLCVPPLKTVKNGTLGAVFIGQLGALVILPLFMLAARGSLPAPPAGTQAGWLALYGLLSAGSFICHAEGAKHLLSHEAGAIIVIEAPTAIFCAWLLLGQQLSANAVPGGAMVLLAALALIVCNRTEIVET